MIALPLVSDTDADNTTLSSPPTADNTGLTGAATGVTLTSLLSGLSPELFTARTMNAYAVPLLRPVTVWAMDRPVSAISTHAP